MYKNFIQTEDSGYVLKKQGIVSVIIFGGLFLALSLFLLITFFFNHQRNILIVALIMLAFGLLICWRLTGKFIIYPKQKKIKYSRGKGIALEEFAFDEFDGSILEKTKDMTGITLGNSFKLGFEKNGKYKEIILGQNVSAKKMRSINEEINQIMMLNN